MESKTYCGNMCGSIHGLGVDGNNLTVTNALQVNAAIDSLDIDFLCIHVNMDGSIDGVEHDSLSFNLLMIQFC
jgi:hypothetical protein